MIILAYDGSLNGDWVARYAIRFASHASERTLTLLHILDGNLSEVELKRKLERIERECRAMGVELFSQVLPLEKSVFFSLLKHIPRGPDQTVICGTRIRTRQRTFLSGTIAEKLLRTGYFPVMAIRVVQPGLLGGPRDLLLPLAGHPRGFKVAWPFFRLFLPDVDRVFLLRAMCVHPLHLPHLSLQRRAALRQAGDRFLANVEEELRSRRGQAAFALDRRVAICDDWVWELLVHASNLKVSMMLLGASERPLGHRMLHGNALERLLRGTPCDVGIYRSL